MECSCEVLENYFGTVESWIFLIDYDRAKCQERVGENDIENGLTV